MPVEYYLYELELDKFEVECIADNPAPIVVRANDLVEEFRKSDIKVVLPDKDPGKAATTFLSRKDFKDFEVDCTTEAHGASRYTFKITAKHRDFVLYLEFKVYEMLLREVKR